MEGMFREAIAFNQPLDRWDVSEVPRWIASNPAKPLPYS